jgi:exopolysaccharide biosynthesis WecB/TagA/CpsF family protein
MPNETLGSSWFDQSTRVELLQFHFDHMTLSHAAETIARRSTNLPFNYVVTPNVDHVNRVLLDRPDLMPIYDSAWLCLCDSRVLSHMARWKALDLPAVPGASLVAELFERHVEADDPITIVGGTEEVIQLLRNMYGLTNIAHYNPPMGFIDDPSAVEACVEFVAANPGRFTFIAVGSPQQEILARRIARAGTAINVGLCVGAALNLLVGIERRAPEWMQRNGLEWLHRLIENPQRMWHRYLVRGPRIFGLFFKYEIIGAIRRQKIAMTMAGRTDG